MNNKINVDNLKTLLDFFRNTRSLTSKNKTDQNIRKETSFIITERKIQNRLERYVHIIKLHDYSIQQTLYIAKLNVYSNDLFIANLKMKEKYTLDQII